MGPAPRIAVVNLTAPEQRNRAKGHSAVLESNRSRRRTATRFNGSGERDHLAQHRRVRR